MKDLEKTIKHFESQQKRYKTQHDGRPCERIEDALEALRHLRHPRELEGSMEPQKAEREN